MAPDPTPEGAALQKLVEDIRALQPDLLPDMRHLSSFRNAENLAFLGNPSAGTMAGGDQVQDEEDAEVYQEQDDDLGEEQFEDHDEDPELEQEDSDNDSDATDPGSQIVPKKNRKRNAPSAAPAPVKTELDRGPLEGKSVPVEVYLFDESISSIKSVSLPPWHYIGTTDLPLSPAKRPIDVVDLTIGGIGGQATIGSHLTRAAGPNEAKDSKIQGNAVIWMALQEYGRKKTEGWYFCGGDLLRAFLEEWIERDASGDKGDLEVRVLLWRHDEARKARSARQIKIPSKPDAGTTAV